MKTTFSKLFIAALILVSTASFAQLTPAPSSTQTILQNFGLGQITLTYSRPNVKGRKMLGGMEPYGKVWRTGANSATVIKFTDDVTLEGHKVPAGEYGLFSIPNADKWTIILSKTSKQWGAYSYKEADDFLRFDVTPVTLQDNIETFTMQFANVYPTTGELHLMWEHTAVMVHLTVDVDAKVMARIDSAMQSPKKPYYDAVVYYWNNNKDMGKALTWANEMANMPGLPPFIAKLWKARVELKKGDKASAAATAQEGITAAKAAKNDEYVHLNEEVLAQAKG